MSKDNIEMELGVFGFIIGGFVAAIGSISGGSFLEVTGAFLAIGSFLYVLYSVRKAEEERQERKQREKLEWEKAQFHDRRWTTNEASSAMEEYTAELKRRKIFSDPWDWGLRDIPTVELHERIGFLETKIMLVVDREEAPASKYTEAQRRSAWLNHCESESETECSGYLRRRGKVLSALNLEEQEQHQRIRNYWADKSDKGPPRRWEPSEAGDSPTDWIPH